MFIKEKEKNIKQYVKAIKIRERIHKTKIPYIIEV